MHCATVIYSNISYVCKNRCVILVYIYSYPPLTMCRIHICLICKFSWQPLKLLGIDNVCATLILCILCIGHGVLVFIYDSIKVVCVCISLEKFILLIVMKSKATSTLRYLYQCFFNPAKIRHNDNLYCHLIVLSALILCTWDP